MKFTLNWLREYVDVDALTPEQLADRLTMLGLEVDAVTPLYSGLDGLLTAEITTVRAHPNADRLVLCDVNIGQEIVQVVCGAPNARIGLLTVFAGPGVTLPTGMKIRKAKVRGEESAGMLCSEKELGLSEDHSGIMELEADIRPGIDFIAALELQDTMIEIDLTPNRPDCSGVLGIAREVAGFTGNPLTPPLASDAIEKIDDTLIDFTVEIKAPDLCPRYSAKLLKNVQIGPSPWWLKKRLLAVGMRPINNVVDITNLVMLEYGQPMHAFDATTLAGRKIVVRRPTAAEFVFTTLDNTQRQIDPDTLMICDADKPVAVAGVMGGLDSEVTPESTEILLESACFDPVSIRRTARQLNLHSESAYRFERGVDPGGTLTALERAVQLMTQLTGADQAEGGIDNFPGSIPLLILPLRIQRTCELLGMELSAEKIGDLLSAIEFGIVKQDDDTLQVTVPSFRVDIEREVDLVEEVARLIGYNEIPTTLPYIEMAKPPEDPLRVLAKSCTEVLVALGFFEAINYSFVPSKNCDNMALPETDNRRDMVDLLNPLTEDQSVLRTMLLPGLLENIRRNNQFQQNDIRLFEIGKVFLAREKEELPDEKVQLCAVMSGSRYPGAPSLYYSDRQMDFFDIKGAAETLIRQLHILDSDKDPSSLFKTEEQTQPYGDSASCLSILLKDQELGKIGKLSAKVGKQFGIKQDVFFLELDLEKIGQLKQQKITFKPLPKYPAVKRDIALLVPSQVAAHDLLQAIYTKRGELVEFAEIFDVYQGKSIEEGMKSIAVSVTYRSSEKTLDDETVDKFHETIVNSLMSRFQGRYREK